MYLLFANLFFCQAFEKITRKIILLNFNLVWVYVVSFEFMWSYTICWDTKDFSCKFSTNNCLLTLNPLSIVLWLWEKTKMLPQTLQKLIYFWFLWRNLPGNRSRSSVDLLNVANFSIFFQILHIAALYHQSHQQLPILIWIIFQQEPGTSSLIFLFLQPLHLVIRRHS